MEIRKVAADSQVNLMDLLKKSVAKKITPADVHFTDERH